MSATSTPTHKVQASAPDSRYIDLGKGFMDSWTWTNDPKDLELDIYFDPQSPNTATTYGIPSLKPIIKERRGSTYILRDDKNNYYAIDVEQSGGGLFKFRQTFKTFDDVLDMVLGGISWHDMDRQFNPKYNGKHPS